MKDQENMVDEAKSHISNQRASFCGWALAWNESIAKLEFRKKKKKKKKKGKYITAFYMKNPRITFKNQILKKVIEY